MLFSTSPVKSISEKIKPLSESGKGKVSRLKFDRKNDYKTFLNFIKKNTRDLEEQQVKKEKKTSTGAFGIIGLGLLGGLFGGGKKDDNAIKTSFIPKAIQRAKLDAESEAKKKKDATAGTTLTSGSKAFIKLKNFDKVRKPQPYSKKNLGKEYIYNRERRDKIVKSKESVKESVVNQERAYNKNRVKKKFSTSNITVGQPVGAGAGSGKITPPERPQIFDNPVDRINAENLKKGKKLLNPNLAKQGFDPKSGMTDVGANVKKNFDAQSGRTTRPTPPRSGQTPFDENIDLKKLMGMDIKPARINDKNFENFKKVLGGDLSSDDLDNLIEINRLFDESDGKPMKLFDRRPKLSERFMFNPNTNRAGGSRFTSMGNFFGDKSFTAPDVPKAQPKLSGFDKFNRFTNRIFNSPAYKFGSFIGGMMTNYKLEIIKQLLTPTPLADGTLEGKPGVGINPENFIFNEDAAVNIFDFSEGRESMIPFDANVKLPSVSKPQNLPTPTNEIFVDFEFDTTEDLFFMKMGGS
jgi:predicted metal-binding transcription factor (methanogenesis marker protein 9)